MRRSKKPAMVTVSVMSGLVAYHFGDLTGVVSGGMSRAFGAAQSSKKIVAGKPRYFGKNAGAWQRQGRIVGLARSAPDFEVKVLDSSGRVVKTGQAETLKKASRAYELWLSPGTYTLLVTAAGYQALDVHNLTVKAKNDLRVDLEFESGTSGSSAKKIAAGKPARLSRPHAAWATKGRIVGKIRDCPGCTVKALDGQRNVVKSCQVKPKGGSYELEWLSPGIYTLLVTADGYEAFDVHGLEVKAKSDLRVDLEF